MTINVESISEWFDIDEFRSLTFEGRVIELHRLDRVISELRHAREEWAASLYYDWPQGEDGHPAPFVAVEGVPPLVRETRGKGAEWDHEGLRAVLAAQVADEMVDRATGEVPPLGVIVARAMEALAETFGITPSAAWRSGALKARGIDPSAFCNYKPGKATTVKFRYDDAA